MVPGRIVVVGEPAPGGLRSSLISAFTMLGRKVDTIDWGPWRPAQLAAAAFRAPRLAARFRRHLRHEIDQLADGGETDLVLVVKGTFLDTRTIEHFRRRLAAPVVCWNPDSPFDGAVSNRGAGIPSAIGAYDTYVTWADDVAERLALQSAHVIVIPFAWDSEIHRPTAGRGIRRKNRIRRNWLEGAGRAHAEDCPLAPARKPSRSLSAHDLAVTNDG